MKNIILVAAALLMGLFTLTSCDDDNEIKYSKLPDAAKTFIEQYFPGEKVTYIERDTDNGRKEYDVKLANGTKLQFDELGAWESVDCRPSPLPTGIIPEAIVTHMVANYPDVLAYKIEKEMGGYEVSIGANRELIYAIDGTFVREQRD